MDLEKFGVKDVYEYCVKNNKSDRTYHNTEHCKRVCDTAIEGCIFYKMTIPYTSLIASAALFHDFNHNGSKDDSENILESIKGFLEFQIEKRKFTPEEESVIISLIKVTRYPYLKECGSLSPGERILRDSDILQSLLHEDYMDKIVFALADELKIPREDMIGIQINFLNNLKFCTDWANDRLSDKLPGRIKELEDYKFQ